MAVWNPCPKFPTYLPIPSAMLEPLINSGLGAPCQLDHTARPASNDGDHAQALRDAQARIALFAALLESETLSVAAHRLAATLAVDGGFDRVSIGLCERGRTRLIASSHLDLGQTPPELEQLLLGAMDEALEQGHSLTCPAIESDTIQVLVEHQLLQHQVNAAIATVPLGLSGEHFAAVCVERRGGTQFTSSELLGLEQRLVLAAPALRWMHAAHQSWHRRARQALWRYWAALRRPERNNRRRMLIGAFLVAAFVALVPLEDHVGGRARIEGFEQRTISAPTDSFIKTAHVRPGDIVKAGDPLVDLLEADLHLERERWTSQLVQHENAYASAMARSDRFAAATSIARVSEAQAQLALVDGQLARARIAAPFDAQVIQGDLSQSIGAPVRQGDTLLTLATIDRQRVVVEVDEVDIARVKPGQAGQLALSSLPWEQHDLVVDRIAPISKPVDGRNVFEVVARLSASQADLRPGLLGRAELVTGRAPVLWAWTRHALLRLRVSLWSWLE